MDTPKSKTSKRRRSKGKLSRASSSLSLSQPPSFKYLNSADYIYQCRKPLFVAKSDLNPLDEFTLPPMEDDFDESEKIVHVVTSISTMSSYHVEDDNELASKRKVSKALLGMAMNKLMAPYFINSGGIEAVFRLISESKDSEVLGICACCITQTSGMKEFVLVLIRKYVIQNILTLIEYGNEEIRFQCSRSIANLTSADSQEYGVDDEQFLSSLITNGTMLVIQMLFNKCKRADSVSYTLLSLCNIAPALTENNDTEVCVRFTLSAAKRLDVLNDFESAFLVSEVVVNLSRIPQFTFLLCEEGILVVILALIDQHYNRIDIVSTCTESIVNLSANPKNRRKLMTCGIQTRLLPIFDLKDPYISTNMLTLVCNMLKAGYFHDKIANEEIIKTILFMLHHKFHHTEMRKQKIQQFLAATHCVAEMSKVTSTAELIVQCGVVKIVLNMLHQILILPEKENIHQEHSKLDYHIEVEAMSYLWSILASLSNSHEYLRAILIEPELMIVISKEAQVGLYRCRIYVTHLLLHISKYITDSLISELPQQMECLNLIVSSVKKFISFPLGRDGELHKHAHNHGSHVVSLSLHALIYLAENVQASRTAILSSDLLQIIQDAVPMDEHQTRVDPFSAGLLFYILSKEDSLCIRLLESGIHTILVSFASFAEKEGSKINPKPLVRESKKKVQLYREAPAASEATMYAIRFGDLIAATLLNISLKRAVLSADVLCLLLNLLRNCKTSRAMWIPRCLAQVSAHPRAKTTLIKEPRLVGCVTGVMRNGSEEAEKAQLYCSMVLCNFLAQPLSKSIAEKMMKSGEVTDLVVVTLLRVSTHVVGTSDSTEVNKTALNHMTKESLGKALFNLLSMQWSRAAMVQLGVFDALVDLSKLDNVNILELSMRAIYNITLETPAYYAALIKSCVPCVLCDIMTSFGHGGPLATHQGARPTHKIKIICGKAMGNIAFHLDLVFALAKCPDLVDALVTIYSLNSQETTYCVCATLFNLSIPETSDMMLHGRRNQVVALATSTLLLSKKFKHENEKESTAAVALLVSVVQSLVATTGTPLLSGQLAVAALCNLSLIPGFHEQLSALAMGPMISVLSSPRCGLDIKIDVIRFLFNVVTSPWRQESRASAIQNGVVQGIISVLKLMTPEDDATMYLLSCIVVELCNEKELSFQIVLEGISKTLVRLAKVENPSLKLNIALALFRLSQLPECVSKLMQMGDGIECLFWLTIHDCLSEFGPILANVSRSLKNFCLSPSDIPQIIKEERLFSVLRVLAKSTSEDILWQTGAAVLNILKIEEARPTMVKREIVPLIFELAKGGGANGFMSVRYLCSASLHSIPEALPDMKDPTVLPLVLCLLEINEQDQSKFDPAVIATDEITPPVYGSSRDQVDPLVSGSTFVHSARCFDFEASPGAEVTPPLTWITMTCEVETAFIPVGLNVMTEEDTVHLGGSTIDLTPPLRSTALMSNKHAKLKSSEFGEFKGDMSPTERDAEQDDDDDDSEKDPNSHAEEGYEDESFEAASPVKAEPPALLTTLSGEMEGTSMDSSSGGGSRSNRLPMVSLEASNSKRPITPAAKDTVSLIKKGEFSPQRPPRSGGTRNKYGL